MSKCCNTNSSVIDQNEKEVLQVMVTSVYIIINSENTQINFGLMCHVNYIQYLHCISFAYNIFIYHKYTVFIRE